MSEPTIQVWYEPRKECAKNWLSCLMIGKDEVALRRYELPEEAFDGARRALQDYNDGLLQPEQGTTWQEP